MILIILKKLYNDITKALYDILYQYLITLIIIVILIIYIYVYSFKNINQ